MRACTLGVCTLASRCLLVAVSLALVATLFGGSAGAQPGRAPTPAAIEDSVAERSSAAADELGERQLLGGELKEKLSEQFGDRLGVTGWTEGSATFEVALVMPNPADVSVVDDLATALGLDVIVESAAMSRSELYALRDGLERVVAPVLGEAGWSLGIDLDTQRVYLSVESIDPSETDALIDRIRPVAEREVTAATAALRPSLSERAAASGHRFDDAIDSVFAIVAGSVESVDFRETAHLRGGEYLRVPRGGRCTSGYRFQWNNTFHRMSSAGHCAGTDFNGVTGGTMRHVTFSGANGAVIGTVTHNYLRDEGKDVLLFTLPSTALTQSRITTTASHHRDVTGRRTTGQMNGNDTQCFVGLGIRINDNVNKKCGPLKKEGVTWKPTGHPAGWVIRNLWCLERRTYGGDSGGPVYYEVSVNAHAAGTMVGSKKETPLFQPVNWFACYHVISDIEAVSGYSLVLS